MFFGSALLLTGAWLVAGVFFAAPAVAGQTFDLDSRSLLDDAMIESFGFPKPLPGTRAMARGALKLRGRLVRWLPARREPHFFTDGRNRTYPTGYEIAELGPPRLIARTNKKDSTEESARS